ncbi:MAG: phosphoribosylanthranilate isomerase [Dehalococcoidia bacterium]|jgi:phosphoribosylanthranilate isomerase|nr:phosphoribosylanthranilate isomerase [Dehalococcoidia bacterium]
MRTQIKICGLRSVEVATVASEAGADFLGFNFVEGVRRQLQPEEGARIIAAFKSGQDASNKPVKVTPARIVGLFRNQDADWVNRVARDAGLDFLQLNGEEDDGCIETMELPVIRQVRVREGTTPGELDEIVSHHLDAGRIVLLDRYDKDTPGGTGLSFDWAAAEGVASRENVLLAGGLKPENVQSAIAQLAPWGVDVASGVEVDGVKDPARIRAFIEAVQTA